MNSVIRRQSSLPEGQITVVDSERLFEDGGPGLVSVPGGDYFYDHVHLSFTGNFIVAKAMTEAIVSQISPPSRFSTSLESVSTALVYTDWDELRLTRELTEQLLSKPPFTNQWNHRERQLARRRQLNKIAAQFTPEIFEKTREQYEAGIERRPNSDSLKRRMSKLLLESGDREKALQILLSVVRDDPENIEAYNELSLVSVSLGKYDEAEKSILKTLDHNPYAIEARNAYLLILFNSRRFEEAADYAENLIEDHPGDPGFRFAFAEILDAQGKRPEVKEQLKNALRIDPRHSRSRKRLIEIYQREKDIEKALQVARGWLLVDPDSAEAQNELAQNLSLKNDYKSALEHYRKAIELDPDFVVARSNYVKTMAGLGRIHEAIPLLTEELALDPEIREGYSLLGLALDVAGRRKEAARVFMSGLQRKPNNVKILRELAWIKATSKDSQLRNGSEALQLAKRAVELSPSEADFHQVLAAAYAENRQFDSAISSARRALELAGASNQQSLSGLIRQCLSAYENKQPIRVD